MEVEVGVGVRISRQSCVHEEVARYNYREGWSFWGGGGGGGGVSYPDLLT